MLLFLGLDNSSIFASKSAILSSELSSSSSEAVSTSSIEPIASTKKAIPAR